MTIVRQLRAVLTDVGQVLATWPSRLVLRLHSPFVIPELGGMYCWACSRRDFAAWPCPDARQANDRINTERTP